MAEYELSRRDALVALSAVAGATTLGLAATTEAPQADDDGGADAGDGTALALSAHERDTVCRVAETLYPGEVTNVEAFVTAYLDGLRTATPDRVRGLAEAVALLDDHAAAGHDTSVADLDPATRDEVLRSFGLDRADPVPDGDRVERVRHYLVDELLLALYASPTGGELVGLPNPPGHPGGLGSYRRGPDGE